MGDPHPRDGACQAARSHQNTITNYAVRFRFHDAADAVTSQFIDLWDRGLRSREEGRAGPFASSRRRSSAPKPAKDRVVGVTTLSDPSQEMDKVQELYTKLVEARREAGQEGVPFHKFAELVKKQVGTLKEKGSTEVAFRVALKDGKVAFTARAMKDGKSTRIDGSGRGFARRRQAAPGRSYVVLGLADVPRLRTLGTIDDLELDRLTLFQGPEAVATDRGVVDEHVAATLALNEPVALGVIEPLDLACNTHRSSSLLALTMSFETQKKTASACAASTSTL